MGRGHGPVHVTAEHTVQVEKDVEKVAMKALGIIEALRCGDPCL